MQWLVVFAALAMVALTGWMDYLISWEMNLFLVYSLPIVLVVWKVGWRSGLLFALLCAVTWWLAQTESNPYQSSFGFELAVFSRLIYFAVLVVAVATVKSRREHDRMQIERLERAQVLEREILQASEREQQRIGRDLHDSMGPHLAAIGYAASFLANDLRDDQ